MGLLAIAAGLATTIAPALGGLLASFGWRIGFVFLAVVAFVPFLAAWFWLPETNRYRASQSLDLPTIARNYGTLLRSPTFMGYALVVSTVNAWFFAFIAASPFLLIERLGLPEWGFGLCILVHTGGYWFGAAFASRYGARIGIDRMIMLGLITTCLGFLVMLGIGLAGVFTVAAIVIPMFFTGLTSALCFPSGQASAISAFPLIAGTASALLGLFQMGSGAVTSYVASLLVHHDQVPVTTMMLILSVIGLPALALAARGRRKP
jgi:DHA1 family bicyclomycin/chloramphenicol resistance-like MFS transporter